MKLFGLYFEPDVGTDIADEDVLRRVRRRNRVQKIYSACVTVVLWLNIIRMTTIFTPGDQMGSALFWKLILFLWAVMCACLNAVTFYANLSGHLKEGLKDMSAFENNEVFVRRRAVIINGICWFVLGIDMLSSVYIFCWSSNGSAATFLAPVGTLIPKDRVNMGAIHSYSLILMVFFNTSSLLPVMLDYLLAMTIARQFQRIQERFEKSLTSNSMSLDPDSFERFRLEHQSLTRVVDKIDRFISLHNAAMILFAVCMIILVVYNLIWYPTVNKDLVLSLTNAYWLTQAILGVLFAVGAGIMVNQAVGLKRFVYTHC